MKYLVAGVLCFCAFSAYSADLSSTIARLEFDNNVSCTKVRGGSLLKLCSGSFTCIYTSKFKCVSFSSAESDFVARIKVKEFYNNSTHELDSKVLKVTIKR